MAKKTKPAKSKTIVSVEYRADGPPDVPEILAKIEAAENYYKGKYEKMIDRSYLNYRGEHWRKNQVTDDASDMPDEKAVVNLSGNIVNDQAAFLFWKKTRWRAEAPVSDYADQEILVEHLMRYEWDNNEMDLQIGKALLDLLITGTCVVQTGYTIELNENQNPTTDGYALNPAWIKKDAPWCERIHPKKLIIDPDATDKSINTAMWVDKIFYRPYGDVINDASYKKEVRSKIIEGEYNVKDKCTTSYLDDNTTTRSESFENQRMCKMHEYFDLRWDKWMILAEGCPEALDEDSYKDKFGHLDRFPFVVEKYYALPDEMYGYGIPKWIKGQQDMVNFIRTFQFQHVRRHAQQKYLHLKGAIDEPAMSQLLSGEDGAFAEVKNPIKDSVGILPTAPITPDLFSLEGVCKQDIMEATGEDQIMRSGPLPSDTSAREVTARTNVAGVKLDPKKEIVRRLVFKVGLQIFQHLQHFMIKERVLKISGASGQYWKTISQEDIRANYRLALEPIAKPDYDPEARKRDALLYYQTFMTAFPLIAQQAQAQGKAIDILKIHAWLGRVLEIEDAEEWFPDISKAPMATLTTTGADQPSPPMMPPVPPPPSPTSNQGHPQAVNPASMMQGMMGGMK